MTALSEAAGGEIFPTLAVTLAYVEACGGDPAVWERRWRTLAAEFASADAAERAKEGEDAPYLGLVTFDPGDADRFFGRKDLVAELCARLEGTSLLAVFGPSGSGKSSLLRAGLLPALWGGALPGSKAWPTLLLTPGEHPLEELAIGLANATGVSASSLHAGLTAEHVSARLDVRQLLEGRPRSARAVIVVDQFEEVFTLCGDERERVAFLDWLLAAADDGDRARVVLGVRADFYARCAEHPPLVAALRDRQLLIGPMDEDDLRQVVTGPAVRAGLRVDRALVEAILGDCRREPGALPLLSHALLETWKRRRGDAMTLAGYRAAGGIQGAIAQSAERVYDEFGDEERHLVKNVFLRLTALGEGTQDTRRRVAPDELLSGPNGTAVATVLTRLTEARLLSVDEDSVQVAHEAVIRSWPRLRGWLAEDREFVRLHRRLTEAATEWGQHGREDELLYRGIRLTAWEGRELDRLNDLERAFLEAARAREARERTATGRRARLLLIGATVVGVVVCALAVMALVMADRARHGQELAYSRQLAADARGQLQLDPQLGLLMARRAYEVSPTVEAASVLRQAVADSRVSFILPVAGGKVCGAVFSPDGRLLATSSGDGTIRVWKVNGRGLAGNPVVLRGHDGEAWSPAFSPDGRYLAAGGIDGTVRLWDLTGADAPEVLRGHKGPVWNVSFSPDGRRLADAGDDGTVRVWDLAGGDAPEVLRGHEGRVLGVVFSPDGRSLATGGGDGTVRLWDPEGGTRPTVLRGHENSVEGVAFSPDGRRLASASTDGTVRMWDVVPGDGSFGVRRGHDGSSKVLRGHDGTVEGVAFGRDGRVASVGNDGTVHVWGAGGTIAPLVLSGHRGTVWSAAFSPDGRTLASASDDGTVRMWDVVAAGDATIVRGHTGEVWSAELSPDGRRVASAGSDGTIRVGDVTGQGSAVVLRPGGGETLDVAFSPDGRRVAGAVEDGVVRVWDAAGRGEPVLLHGHLGLVWSVAFSPDGRRVASAGNDGTARVWDAAGRGEPLVLRGHRGVVRYVAFSPDGRRVASAGEDGTVRVWDVSGHDEPVVLRGHQGLVWGVSFGPDGRRVASGGNDGTVRVRDVSGRGEPVVLRGHQGLVWSVSFSPDGQWVASGGNDNTVRIWAATGRGEPVVFQGHGASVESVGFGRDGRHLVTAHGDATVRVWRCDVCGPMEQVLRLARDHTVRELTPDERKALLQASG
ncbi:nSTAND1 domain-containing NTPase [Streptosporangium sp. G11]|uniref:nSTAND1 domain-containing NTPase n=1 Tax=Streptosporangium sp. G11 TaxID=3436926 RepID=UPI003EBCB8AA